MIWLKSNVDIYGTYMSDVVKAVATDADFNFYQRMVIGQLSKIKIGGITLLDNERSLFFGDEAHHLQASLHIQSNDFYKQIFWNGAIGFAEGYILEIWKTDDLTKLLQVFAANLDIVDKVDQSPWGMAFRLISNFVHYINRDNVTGARKNISRHYDLGNDFFSLFLDPHMMYSAAKFSSADYTLEQASKHKLQMLCEKLQLQASDHLVEIGGGWGSFAIHAAQNFGCRVTTTTISKEQYDYSKHRIAALGLQNQITVLLQDYRELSGTYDKLVSIEMIEHVGHHYLGTYLQKCSDLLKPNGIFVLQSIVIAEQQYLSARDSVDFIKKYIFPGGCVPALGEMLRYIRTHTDLNVFSIEDLTLDYAKTLAAWRKNLLENIKKVLTLKFDMLFVRKWIYYLCYCEAGFLERRIGDLQIVFTKPNYRTQHDLP